MVDISARGCPYLNRHRQLIFYGRRVIEKRGKALRLVDDSQKKLKLILNFSVLIIALIVTVRQRVDFRETSTFENMMIDTFTPVQSGVNYLHGQVSNFFNHYLANISASRDNERLKKQISEMNGQLFSAQELSKENFRLKELLEFGQAITFRKVLAQVVAWDSNSDYQVIRINKGHKNGIRLQSPVVTVEGLVGYIFRMTDNFADVLTIMDNNNRVDGLIHRVRAHGIIEGFSTERAMMKYVSRTEPIILGDIVITSGLGNIYPKGIEIGEVSRIERESYGITQYVEISPVVDFGRLEEVIVLVGEGHELRKKEWEALDKIDSDQGEGI
jgi:rod shape-determining protein MreC